MPAVCIQSKNGKRLMPTTRYGHVRHLLKDGKAKIVSRRPFTIQLLYETKEIIQPLELGADSGYQHVGISVKSERREFFSAEFDLLPDEKKRHDDQKTYRRNRRNRKRHRKPKCFKAKPEGWIAPSLQHKLEAQEDIIVRLCKAMPIQKVTVERGEFDLALLKALETGAPIPKGLDYQHGPTYYEDSLRAAVFQRDRYTCQVCGKSAIGSGKPVYFHEHHALYWMGRHADTLDEMLTVCEDCHTPSNHQKGGKLWGLKPKVARLEGAAFMNIVRYRIITDLQAALPDVEVRYTYGAVTSRKRKDAGLEKSHANDAFCIGGFMPVKRAETERYRKRRRNNRRLEKFYDAKYIDVRDGSVKTGKELGCNRTNRREPCNTEKSLRIFRGPKVSKGQRRIRRMRYAIQAGDKVLVKGRVYPSCHGTMSGGRIVLILNAKESPTGKAVTASPNRVTVLRYCGGWSRIS